MGIRVLRDKINVLLSEVNLEEIEVVFLVLKEYKVNLELKFVFVECYNSSCFALSLEGYVIFAGSHYL